MKVCLESILMVKINDIQTMHRADCHFKGEYLMKLKIYRQCLENPGTTNAQLFEKFGVTDDVEKQQIVKWKQDCLHCLAVLNEIQKDHPKRSAPEENNNDDILIFLRERKGKIEELLNWFANRRNDIVLPEVELTGENRRMTLHLNVGLMGRLKVESEKQKVSVSRIVNMLIHQYLKGQEDGR